MLFCSKAHDYHRTARNDSASQRASAEVEPLNPSGPINPDTLEDPKCQWTPGGPFSGHCEIPGLGAASGPGPRQELDSPLSGRSFMRISKKSREVGALTNLQAKTTIQVLSPAMTRGLNPRNGKEEPGDCLRGSWLRAGGLRTEMAGNQTIPCLPKRGLKLKLAQHSEMFYAAPTSAPSSATHLVSPSNDLQHLRALRLQHPEGKQKDLSVEGGKPGSGWGPPVPGDLLNSAPPGEEDATHSSPFPQNSQALSSGSLGICRNLAVADPNVYAKDSQESETLLVKLISWKS